jgi:hypothetical protein
VIVAGEAADRLGLGAVTVWYFVGLALFVGSALTLSRRLVASPVRDLGPELGCATAA